MSTILFSLRVLPCLFHIARIHLFNGLSSVPDSPILLFHRNLLESIVTLFFLSKPGANLFPLIVPAMYVLLLSSLLYICIPNSVRSSHIQHVHFGVHGLRGFRVHFLLMTSTSDLYIFADLTAVLQNFPFCL